MDALPTNEEPRFYTVQERVVTGGHLREAIITGSLTTPKHAHEQAWITLVLQGSCEETYRGETRPFTPLSTSFHHPGETHAIHTFDQGVRSFGIEFDSVWLAQFQEHVAPLADVNDLPPEPLTWLAIRMYREFKTPDDASTLALEGLLLEALAALTRTAAQPSLLDAPRWLRRVEALVQEHYNRSLALSTLAEEADVHPSHLARVFRAHFDCTVGEYVRRVRVARARQQMIDTSAPLAEIALNVGFADQSHFSRTFKALTGMTPSQFRRQFQ